MRVCEFLHYVTAATMRDTTLQTLADRASVYLNTAIPTRLPPGADHSLTRTSALLPSIRAGLQQLSVAESCLPIPDKYGVLATSTIESYTRVRSDARKTPHRAA